MDLQVLAENTAKPPPYPIPIIHHRREVGRWDIFMFFFWLGNAMK